MQYQIIVFNFDKKYWEVVNEARTLDKANAIKRSLVFRHYYVRVRKVAPRPFTFGVGPNLTLPNN
jgi:hypothetical protein